MMRGMALGGLGASLGAGFAAALGLPRDQTMIWAISGALVMLFLLALHKRKPR